MSNRNFSCFQYWFRGHHIGSDCSGTWSLLIFYFSYFHFTFTLITLRGAQWPGG